MKEPTPRTHRIYLNSLSGEDYLRPLREGLAWTTLVSKLAASDRVFIKPNLTFPVFREGVMTSPACVEALVVALKDYTGRITIGEADSGGYNRFKIDEVQERIGLKALEKRYGVRVVNLSHLAQRQVEFQWKRSTLSFPFPVSLMEETDVLVSAAVPKIHMNTLVSMTVKNLWGCIPEPPARLRLHPCLPEVLLAITGRFKRTIGLVDGRYGLNRSGPMRGDPVSLNWLMMGDDFHATDVACCQLMQVDPRRVRHLRNEGSPDYRMPALADLQFSQDWRPFVKEPFYLKRAWTDYPGLLAFRSPALTYLAYFSPLSSFLHKILYLFREPFYDYRAPGETRR